MVRPRSGRARQAAPRRAPPSAVDNPVSALYQRGHSKGGERTTRGPLSAPSLGGRGRTLGRTAEKGVYVAYAPQTGVPFGDVSLVRDFLKVHGAVGKPEHEHPKRPIEGFACTRSEVSGTRLWGTLATRYADAADFFEHAFVANYCPLVFMESSGRNRTPDKLAASEREVVYAACDAHLRALVEALAPRYVIGIGKFAQGRAQAALGGLGLTIGTIAHPSPASPAANRGWAKLVDTALAELGLKL